MFCAFFRRWGRLTVKLGDFKAAPFVALARARLAKASRVRGGFGLEQDAVVVVVVMMVMMPIMPVMPMMVMTPMVMVVAPPRLGGGGESEGAGENEGDEKLLHAFLS